MRTAKTHGALLSLAIAAVSVIVIDAATGEAATGGVQQEQQKQRPSPPERLEPGQTCYECHADSFPGSRQHDPIRSQKCDLCHIQFDAPRHAFTPPADQGAVCRECHTLPERQSFHEPVVKGECLSCHKPHASDQRYLMRKETVGELCGQCHEKEVSTTAPFVHGPVAVGACVVCHSPHSGSGPKLLMNDPVSTCLSCHSEMDERMHAAASVHDPVKQQCTLCHDAHSSNHPFQLTKEKRTLCLDCHSPMVDELKKEGTIHEALLTNDGCAKCHDPHVSSQPKLLRGDVGQLCLDCHDKPIARADGTTLTGMGDLIEHSAFLHGPVQQGDCTACHNPHGSVTFDLLREPYPKKFYAPYDEVNYQLCFRCHDPAVFRDAVVDGGTRFRDGTKNLHFVHVNQVRKGRTCRACHEVHASNLPKHITESVPFGDWRIPVRFKKTPTGGSCATGCHVERFYDCGIPEEVLEVPKSSQLPGPSGRAQVPGAGE